MTQQDTQYPAETLVECPFCGGSAQLMGFNAPEFWVSCLRIGCKAGTESFGSKERAVAAWNRRTSPALTRRAGGDAGAVGWQLVPVQPAAEMTKAGEAARDRQGPSYVEDIWSAMLAATPKPPAGGDAAAVERAYHQGQIDMRDRAAAVCDERGAEEQEGYGLNRAAQNYFRARNAVRALEPAALALPAPVVVGDVAEMDDADIITFAGRFFDPTDNGYGADTRKWVRAVRAALSEGRSHG